MGLWGMGRQPQTTQVAMSPGEDGLIGIPFPEHSSELLSCLNEQRRAGLLCDLTLTSRGARYSTHRSVMAAVSLYFRNLFGAEEGEPGDVGSVGSGCSVCQLDCVAPDALDALLEFAYTATLTIRSSGMRDVLKAAQLLGIQCVADACRDILGETKGEGDEEEEEEEQERGIVVGERTEDIVQSSRRKRDKQHILKSRLSHLQPRRDSPSSSPTAELPRAPTSPGYDEYSPPGGQNGGGQHAGWEPGVINGSKHWTPGDTPLLVQAETGLSEEEDKMGPPPLPERGGVAGGGRKRKSQTPQQCPVCQKIIHGAGKLPRHMRTHTGEKPFQCSACGVRFTRNDKLKIHMRKHTGERPYPCPHCPARFLHSYDLKNHLSLHSGARPFECPLCHKAFVREDHLQRHRKGHSCLEVRTRRPRRGAGSVGEAVMASSLLDSIPLSHASAFSRSPPPTLGRSPFLPDVDGPPIPLHAMPLLGPRGPPYPALLFRGVEVPGGPIEELGAPNATHGPPGPQKYAKTDGDHWQAEQDSELKAQSGFTSNV
uniref:Zinc finger and BTB domain containing 7B n=1 Tax=Paramormyrops kingsleyae TaxID=1676925 RepID=A0A3B3SHU8_9TELE